MRVLLALHQYLPESVGGTEVYTQSIARRLQDRDHEVAIVSYSESPSGRPEDYGIVRSQYEGTDHYRIEYNLSVAPHPLQAEYNNEFTQSLFKKILDQWHPDLVHFTHVMKLSGSTLQSCSDAGIPFLVTLADFWIICPRHTLLKWNDKLCSGPRHDAYCIKCVRKTHGFFGESVMKIPTWGLRLWSLAAKPLARRGRDSFHTNVSVLSNRNAFLQKQLMKAERVICLSEFQRQMLIKNGYDADSLLFHMHGIEDLEPGSKKHLKRESIVLVLISSIVRHKGVHLAVKAVMDSHNDKLRLIIYGDVSGNDPYRADIREMAAGDPRISLAGRLPEDKLGETLRDADAMLLPVIWYENEPLVMKMALKVNTPVIASKIGSIPEFIHHGANGWLLPAGKVEAWTRYFDKLTIEQIQALNHQTIKIKSMNESFEEIYTLYNEIWKK